MPDGPVRGLACLCWMYREVLEWSLIRIAFLLIVAFASAFGLVQTTTFNLDAAPVAHVLLWVGVSGWVRGHFPGALAVYAEVATLAFLLSGLLLYIACQRVKERYAHLAIAPAATATGGFFERLPPMLGEDVVYLGVSGHYLNVVTTAGSHPVLMRLSDAVAALGDLGMQVHRSYWVAFQHLTGAVRRDARTLVCLTAARKYR